tara:strand:- start:385 stop:621 length:237 start_codon:yes stop_codon:yes gene_type:complete
MDFKDIKTWGVLLSIIIALGSGFKQFGELSTRLSQLEKVKKVDIKPLEQDIAILKAETAVLNAVIMEMKQKASNPMQR